ncbi:MAG: hypothetical protein IT208_03955 [Chthonomonadales bacterium]|nr:hypothetical protein [Chthonomonadales bacterium]
MSDTLYAQFADPSLAERAAGALLDYGVRKGDLSLLTGAAAPGPRPHFVTERGVTVAADATGYGDAEGDLEAAAKGGITTTTPGDAASGAAKGAGIGLGVGVIAALAAIAVPGFGLVAGGGALATAIGAAAGTTAAGAVAGGAYGYLKDQGVPDRVAEDYNAALEQGGALLAVTLPSGDVDRPTAEGVLAKYGAGAVSTYGIAA